MKNMNWILVALLTVSMAFPVWAEPSSTSTAKSTQKAGEGGSGKSTLRRSNRMEFDGRLVKGEKAAGAVYLFQRAPRRLPPLLKLKRDQLDRIVLPVLKRPADPARTVSADAATTSPGQMKSARTPNGVRSGEASRKGRKAVKRAKKRKKTRKSKRKKRKGKKRR